MHEAIQLTSTIPSARTSLSPALLRPGFLLIPFAIALAWFALSPSSRAVSPAPDGDYGNGNTAEGADALFNLTSGFGNTANGYEALFSDRTGSDNTAVGFDALNINTTGDNNVANGFFALATNTTGNNNTVTGVDALSSNNAGNNNTASGFNALFSNTIGNNNTAEGFQALANSTGSNNIALGANAGVNLTGGSNNIDIGARGVAGESNTIRIGALGLQKSAYMQGISGATVASGVTVIVDTKGHLGTVQSSARFKEAIKPMDKASESVLSLRPVTFHYKRELDPDGIPQFGLVAEQVEKVNPDLVARDENGQVYTVRYEAVNAMLLNEFLKEHHNVEEQEATIAQLKSTAAKQEAKTAKQEAIVAHQQQQIEALTAGFETVSNEIKLIKHASRVVADNQ
jgi:hypothetical protein